MISRSRVAAPRSLSRWAPSTRARSRWVGPVVAAALALSGCGSVAPYAARLGGHRISDSTLRHELEAIANNTAYARALQEGGPVARVDGAGGRGTYDTRFVAYVLTNEIAFGLVHQAVVRRHLQLGRDDLATARASLLGTAGGGGPPDSSRVQIFDAFSGSYQDTLVRRNADARVLRTMLDREYFGAHRNELSEVCARHILLAARDAKGALDVAASKEQADAVEARLAAGEDFGSVAKAVSADPGSAASGGELGCTSASHYVEAFARAVLSQPVGEVGAPVRTPFGFHVIQVTRRSAPTFERYEQEARSDPNAVDRLEVFFEKAAAQTHIAVNPKYGRFNHTTLRVEPPTPPTPPPGPSTARTVPGAGLLPGLGGGGSGGSGGAGGSGGSDTGASGAGAGGSGTGASGSP